ncbi:MAG TPA: hemolysin family protein [Dehalococcoidia bacterium]|nr:hemolysin family protein [Dehalococcoidia bacterium]
MDVSSAVGIAVVALAMALIAFVAAAEAGLVTISRARVRVLAGRGVPRAAILQSYMQERESLLDALLLARLTAYVLAVTVGALIVADERGIGWDVVGIVVVAAVLLVPLLEALPRWIVTRDPERWGLRMSPLMGVFKSAFGLPAHILNLPIRTVLRRRQDNEEDEEMMRMIELEEDEGEIEEDERKMIRGVFGLEETSVREIMTPRIDIVALEADADPREALRLSAERGLSRLPIYEGNLDTIVGVVYVKDLIRYLALGSELPKLRDIARKPFFVPESKRIDDLLTDMRRQRVHMAIVVDEYGGTAGLATIEDLLEEIVGEIEDEHDVGEPNIVVLSETEAVFDGRVGIDELNELFHTDIKGEEFDTVGGCVFHLLGRMPSVGDEAATDGVHLKVLAVDGNRIKRVRVTVEPRSEADHTEPGNGRNGSGRSGNGH